MKPLAIWKADSRWVLRWIVEVENGTDVGWSWIKNSVWLDENKSGMAPGASNTLKLNV